MKSEDDVDSDDVTCDDSSNHLVTFSVKVLRSLVEESATGGDSSTRLIDNPHNRDISRHLYELIWQAVRDKVGVWHG